MDADVARQFIRDVEEVINVLVGYDHELSGIDLPQGHEGHNSIVLVNDTSLGATLNYFAEDASWI